MSKRKILVPIFNRAHYGRLSSLLTAIKAHPELELQIVTAAPAAYNNFFANIKHSRPRSWRRALPWYLRAKLLSFSSKRVKKNDYLARNIMNDGFEVNSYVSLFLDGGADDTMAKSVGLGIMQLVDEFKKLNPDIVFVNADRFEMMAVAIAASYLNIPLAHNEGGDVSGTLDESIRHSITKLSHMHFVSTEQSRKRVVQMGESPDNVFTVGSPAIDVVKNINTSLGPVDNLDLSKPYLVVLMHPVATENSESNIASARALVGALDELAMPTIFLGSNIDAGAGSFGSVIKDWRLNTKPSYAYFAKHLMPHDFYNALSGASCAVGNSSSFIREGAYFGTPSVIVGSRQQKRERCENIKDVSATKEDIVAGVKAQLEHGRYERNTLFGDGEAGERIASLLASVNPKIQKTFFEV